MRANRQGVLGGEGGGGKFVQLAIDHCQVIDVNHTARRSMQLRPCIVPQHIGIHARVLK